MSKLLIDVSYHNGTIDWETAKNHIDGAILRCGYGDDITSQDDKQWQHNADECERLGIPYGMYIYSYAKTAAQAKSEAAHALRLAKGRKMSYPIYLDLEEPGTEGFTLECAQIFCPIIEAAGYWCGIYASDSWWRSYLTAMDGRYTTWIARYSTQPPTSQHDIWQYASDGSIPGVNGKVDVNNCYRDLAAEIGKVATPTPKPTPVPPAATAHKVGEVVTVSSYYASSTDPISKAVLPSPYRTGTITRIKAGAPNPYLLSDGAIGWCNDGDIRSVGAAPCYQAFSAVSIVDGLKSIGADASMAARTQIAAANGISNYTGSAAQNNQLLALARAGQLKK